jgi:signal transduction histidine kinase
MEGERMQEHYRYLRKIDAEFDRTFHELEIAGIAPPSAQVHHLVNFDHGNVMFITLEPVPWAHDIFRRFGKVFEQTYTRFLDLQKAEAQAREAQIEGALEKVRSRTLAMQKSDELSGTAAVLFQQLISLGIAPNRLYIIIMKEDSSDMEAWVTDEDGSKVSMGFTGNYLRNETLHKMYTGWQEKMKCLLIDMQGEELQQYFHYLHDELKVPFKGGLEQKRRIQHIAYFSHGLIGMAAPDEQPAETLQLMSRFAAVFNLTFTRFNDLKIAEAHALQAELDLMAIKEAKQKAEEALSELQATQKQLIQSEKMASLGELTAGIAHEIQNPLNFVNNFSEVSTDLIQELVEEMEKGNTQDAKEIAEDLVKNLQKIHHHGERAASIVKGMLQHSRSSSGQKEPTDINALCDEYLRLAYHGLRAKDKSFNAKFETSFDDSVGKVDVMPQEMGRVILNLINNAFYATGERRKLHDPGYEPCVTVSSKREADKISIRVHDNGTGIPEKVVDKIFQPFFTTKPSGQGTGLGLSLSYDIITKAHGGELKVETKEGEGTAFIIQLPG